MKLTNYFDGVVINSKSAEWERNGNKGTSYSVSVDVNGEAGTLFCTEEVYNVVQSLKYKPCNFVGEYNDQYRNFRVIGATVQGK